MQVLMKRLIWINIYKLHLNQRPLLNVGSHPGIVLFRPMSMGPLAVNRFITEFVRETDLVPLSGCIVVVDPTRVRIRRPPLAPDGSEWEEIP